MSTVIRNGESETAQDQKGGFEYQPGDCPSASSLRKGVEKEMMKPRLAFFRREWPQPYLSAEDFPIRDRTSTRTENHRGFQIRIQGKSWLGPLRERRNSSTIFWQKFTQKLVNDYLLATAGQEAFK
jgi:hypothetical protein